MSKTSLVAIAMILPWDVVLKSESFFKNVLSSCYGENQVKFMFEVVAEVVLHKKINSTKSFKIAKIVVKFNRTF